MFLSISTIRNLALSIALFLAQVSLIAETCFTLAAGEATPKNSSFKTIGTTCTTIIRTKTKIVTTTTSGLGFMIFKKKGDSGNGSDEAS